MEALARAGVPTVLFLAPPRPEQLARFPGVQAVGIAGVSRSLPTAEMEGALRPAFEALKALGAPLVHYKICSTFDSSPTIGSIGRAIEVGQEVFSAPFVPLVVGAPVLGRFCVFGNLWARSGPETAPFRLDRHPTMRRHPTTPMDESDLRVHLARQTNNTVVLFDALDLAASDAGARLQALLSTQPDVVLFDVLYESHLPVIGGLIASRSPRFAAGSSGIEYALAAHWRARGELPADPPVFAADPVEQIVVVSGSCSPVSEGQIARAALEHGYGEVALRGERIVDPATERDERERATRAALDHLRAGRSVIVHTSRGPGDGRIAATRQRLEELGRTDADSAPLLGEALGQILHDLLRQTNVRRAVVAGGDTSGFVARALGIEALEMRAPLAPGSPLCRARTNGPLDGLEILFKGGQVGTINVYESVRRGAAEATTMS